MILPTRLRGQAKGTDSLWKGSQRKNRLFLLVKPPLGTSRHLWLTTLECLLENGEPEKALGARDRTKLRLTHWPLPLQLSCSPRGHSLLLFQQLSIIKRPALGFQGPTPLLVSRADLVHLLQVAPQLLLEGVQGGE